MKIDERTYVPLVWMVISFFSMGSIIVSGSFWVKGVDDRLQRIERRLGISPVAEKKTDSPVEVDEDQETDYADNQ